MSLKRKKEKAKINWGWDAPEDRNGKARRSTRQQKKVNSSFKRLGWKTLLLCFGLFVLFVGISAGSCYLLTRNDCFVLKGKADIVLDLNAVYVEDGYKVIEFGRNVADKVEIETNMIITEDGHYSPKLDEYGNPILGKYYIIYKAKTFKYSKFSTIERIRFVTFDEISDVTNDYD